MKKHFAGIIILIFVAALSFAACQAIAGDAPQEPAKAASSPASADNAKAASVPAKTAADAAVPAAEPAKAAEPPSFDTEVTDPKLEARIQSYNCSLKQLVDKAEKRIKCIDNELKAEENIKLAEDQIKKGDEFLSQGKYDDAKKAYKQALSYQNTTVMKRTVSSRLNKANSAECSQGKAQRKTSKKTGACSRPNCGCKR